MAVELPMFPLGSVLFPYSLLSLHVFEPRYRVLVRHCLATEPEFGVVLIERGSEVGGGDARFDVGSLARITEVAELADGRFALVTIGVRRLTVVEWLPDDPFPRAAVDWLAEGLAGPELEGRVESVRAQLRRVLALRAELGVAVPALDVTLDTDPVVASYQLAALAPIGPLDAQRVLRCDAPGERLHALGELLADELAVLEARLGG